MTAMRSVSCWIYLHQRYVSGTRRPSCAPWLYSAPFGSCRARSGHSRILAHFHTGWLTLGSESKAGSTRGLGRRTILRLVPHARCCSIISPAIYTALRRCTTLRSTWESVSNKPHETILKGLLQANFAIGIDVWVESASPIVCRQCPHIRRPRRVVCNGPSVSCIRYFSFSLLTGSKLDRELDPKWFLLDRLTVYFSPPRAQTSKKPYSYGVPGGPMISALTSRISASSHATAKAVNR